jgi:transcriptional regulator PpsR
MDAPAHNGVLHFRDPERVVGGLDAPAAANAIAVAADLALVVGPDGVVEDIASGNPEIGRFGVASWLTRPWIETVSPDSRAKITEMLASGHEAVARWRQVNHASGDQELPVRYLLLPPGPDGRRLAVGRDMRVAAQLQQRLLATQQAVERDYLRMRQAETRYRLLFDMAGEAMFILDVGRRRIVEANPAAHRLMGKRELSLGGRAFSSLIEPDDRDQVAALLAAVAGGSSPGPVRVRLAESRESFELEAAQFRLERASLLLVRLSPMAAPQAATASTDADQRLIEVVERMPDAFVVADGSLTILAHNEAFLDILQMGRDQVTQGQPLARWLGRPGIDLPVLMGQIREHGWVRNFATVLRGRDGHDEDVEVSAVAVTNEGQTTHGFVLRPIARRAAAVRPASGTPRSVEQLTELVGRVALKDIVRESTDLIERMCIEAALTHTSDNRASAAELLGLSRQSLYSKMHRHGLGNLTAEAE